MHEDVFPVSHEYLRFYCSYPKAIEGVVELNQRNGRQ